MATAEITDDATREDVDAVVKGIMKERLGSEGADKQDTSKQTESTETQVGDDLPADENVEDDAAANQATDKAAVGGEDSGEGEAESRKQDWLTDDVLTELPRGISEEDLSEFSSRDEFDRALALMDRAALRAGREAGKQDGSEESQGVEPTGERSQERSQDGKLRKHQEEKEKGEDTTSTPYEIDLDLSDFDDELGENIKGTLTGLRDHYEARMQSLDERFAALETEGVARETAATEAHFDSVVDSLGYADLFGETGQESKEELKRRDTLFLEQKAYGFGLEDQGRAAPMDKAFLGRVVRMVFADHVSKRELKNHTRRITKQSNMRMGVGAERPSEQEFSGPLKKHPDVRHAFKRLQEAEGEE